jgi:hypothetical protein
MIDRLRRTVRRWTTSTDAPATYPDDHARAAATEARGNRARQVTRLQQEVREIQQRITDLSATQDQGADAPGRTPQSGELESLYRALAHKQGELAKLQARV